MKAILMSIKPGHGYKILHGEKGAEIRKTAPRDTEFMRQKKRTVYLYFTGTGMVLGEFELDFATSINETQTKALQVLAAEACLSMDELNAYGPGRDGEFHYWRVKAPGAYFTPIPLSEFGLKRPPQSWCYVEAI